MLIKKILKLSKEQNFQDEEDLFHLENSIFSLMTSGSVEGSVADFLDIVSSEISNFGSPMNEVVEAKTVYNEEIYKLELEYISEFEAKLSLSQISNNEKEVLLEVVFVRENFEEDEYEEPQYSEFELNITTRNNLEKLDEESFENIVLQLIYS